MCFKVLFNMFLSVSESFCVIWGRFLSDLEVLVVLLIFHIFFNFFFLIFFIQNFDRFHLIIENIAMAQWT